mmetsp:Transcript_11887/g.41682  ORF Transcript_11887/g.41682 Transcript_11887/m.41682 type:complete len:239 (+) Transcript_11887:1075-1791(+)
MVARSTTMTLSHTAVLWSTRCATMMNDQNTRITRDAAESSTKPSMIATREITALLSDPRGTPRPCPPPPPPPPRPLLIVASRPERLPPRVDDDGISSSLCARVIDIARRDWRRSILLPLSIPLTLWLAEGRTGNRPPPSTLSKSCVNESSRTANVGRSPRPRPLSSSNEPADVDGMYAPSGATRSSPVKSLSRAMATPRGGGDAAVTLAPAPRPARCPKRKDARAFGGPNPDGVRHAR